MINNIYPVNSSRFQTLPWVFKQHVWIREPKMGCETFLLENDELYIDIFLIVWYLFIWVYGSGVKAPIAKKRKKHINSLYI